MSKFTKIVANGVIFRDIILQFAAIGVNLRYKFEAIHNKDYSVVKTLRAAALWWSFFFYGALR